MKQGLSDIAAQNSNQTHWKNRKDNIAYQIYLSRRRLKNEEPDEEKYTDKKFYTKYDSEY